MTVLLQVHLTVAAMRQRLTSMGCQVPNGNRNVVEKALLKALEQQQQTRVACDEPDQGSVKAAVDVCGMKRKQVLYAWCGAALVTGYA